MDRNGIDWERLDRYVTGRGTPEELAELEAWISSDPELRAIAAAMRTAGRPPDVEQPPWDVRGAWQRLRRRMGRTPLRMLSPADRGDSSQAVVPGRRTRWLVGAAAAAVVLAAASVLAYTRWHNAAPALREFATRRAQTAVLNLPDGSRVMLGPASRLRVSEEIGGLRAGTSRDIYLEGEAYLEVKHDSTRPLRVHTAAGVAEDIGTEFVVTAYPETPGMRVVVASGIVALYQPLAQASGRARSARERPRALLTIAQGDLAELASTGLATLTRDVDVALYVAWTKGDLAFDATRLGDAVPQLERWYDVDIRLADSSLADRRLTATFRRASLSQVLELLSLSLGVRAEREGRSVLLQPKIPRQVSP